MFSLSRALLLIVGLGFLADLFGTLSGPLSLFMGLGFLVLGLLTIRRAPNVARRPAHLVLAPAVLAAGLVLLALCPHDRVNRLLCAAVLLLGADLALSAFGRKCRGLHPVAGIALISGLFFLMLKYSPLGWKVWTRTSVGLTRVVGNWLGHPVCLGPTYSGLDVTAFFVICAIVLFAFSHRRNWLRLPLTFIYLAAMGLVFIALMTQLPNVSLPMTVPEHPTLFEKHVVAPIAKDAPHLLGLLARHVPWDMPALLFLLQLPALWVVAGGAVTRRSRLFPSRTARFSVAVAIVMALLGVGLLTVRLPEHPVMQTEDGLRPRVVLYRKGFINWDRPDFDTFGSYSGGMLGRLPGYLEMLGFDVEVSDKLDRETLRDARIVAIFNIYENLSNEDRTALWDFVRSGGGLLVVADHTWLNDKGENNLEHLMEPCHVRYNFDSATYHIGGWLWGYDFRAEPVLHRTGQDMNQPSIGVGASLELHRSAEPMLLGRDGFSDEGEPVRRERRGYLGDGVYRPGERLGDLVLMAQEPYGAGRVIAVGDTGPFFNLFMAENHRMTRRLFAKLAASPVIPYHLLRLELALTGFLIALLFFVIRAKRSMLTVLTVGLVSAAGVQALDAWAAGGLELAPAGDVAWISGSQVEKYARESWRPDGLNGLYLNLMRNNLQPLRIESLDLARLSGGRMLFLIEPTRRLTPRQVDDIERFIRAGGYVVVTAGRRCRPAVEPLLGRFGLGVADTPLGRFQTAVLGESARVQFHEAFEVTDKTKKATVLARFDLLGRPGPPVIMERQVPSESTGRIGGLLLIGDSAFLTNQNLESDKSAPNMINIGFVRRLTERVRGLQGAGPSEAREGTP